jgi:hypothetical protein
MRSAITILGIISERGSHGQKPCLTGEPDASKGCTSGSGRGGQKRTCKDNALAAYFTLLKKSRCDLCANSPGSSSSTGVSPHRKSSCRSCNSWRFTDEGEPHSVPAGTS